MKKLFVFGMMTLAMLAFVAAPAFAGDNKACTDKTSKTNTTLTSGKTCQASAKNITESVKAHACTGEMAKACAAEMGMTEEECRALCSKYTLVRMSIDGMTCTGCENSIKTTLTKMPGVHKVAKVSHKTGSVMVFVEQKHETVQQDMVTAVANKGYKVEIIPAVAKADADANAVKAGTKAGCNQPCSKPCPSKKTGTTSASAKAEGTN
jgi:copper chaperone CopZ